MKDNWKEEYSFFDAFAEVHTILYDSPEEDEPDSYLAARLQDRMNIRSYFNTAVSNIATEI